MRTTIIVTLKVPGVHQQTEAVGPFAELLMVEHRHLFHITVALVVKKNDRDREFFSEQAILRKLLAPFKRTEGELYDFGDRSCGQIAEHLIPMILRVAYVEVSEDGENSARVEVDAEGDWGKHDK